MLSTSTDKVHEIGNLIYNTNVIENLNQKIIESLRKNYLSKVIEN